MPFSEYDLYKINMDNLGEPMDILFIDTKLNFQKPTQYKLEASSSFYFKLSPQIIAINTNSFIGTPVFKQEIIMRKRESLEQKNGR